MGKVVHFEIPADDVSRASGFYNKVFGWKVNSMPDMGYTIFHTGPTNEKDGMIKEKGFINGGLMKRKDLIKHPVVTIEVESIENSAKKILENGGTVVQGKMAVGDMGFSAYFKDPEGNILGLWENK